MSARDDYARKLGEVGAYLALGETLVPPSHADARSAYLASKLRDSIRSALAWFRVLVAEPEPLGTGCLVMVGKKQLEGIIEERRGPAVVVRIQMPSGGSCWEWFDHKTGRPIARDGNRVMRELDARRGHWRLNLQAQAEALDGAP